MKTKLHSLSGATRRADRLSPAAVMRRSTYHSLGLLLTATAVGLLATACAPSPEMYQIPSDALIATPQSTLSVGDVVRFTYSGAPEFNQIQKIRADGRVSLPQVGSVKAAGRSISSLQASLTAMYEPHLNDLTVMVSLEQPAAVVYVSGAVNQPGKVPLDRSITALEAVMETGGFSKTANPKQVFVIRNEGGRQRRYPLNLGDPLAGYESRAFYLRPFDVVYVKQSVW